MDRKKRFKPKLALLTALMALMSVVPFSIAANASDTPNVTGISGVSGEFERDPIVYIGGVRVSAQRYIVKVDNVGYEAYCADPGLRGPESAGAVYELSGEANPQLRNALKNGFPINTQLSAEGDDEERMWWAYITRVAVAMANNPTRTFSGNAVALDQAKSLANGSLTADAAAYPPIMVNEVKDAKDTGRIIHGSTAQSISFEVTYNRKTTVYYNPFRFEWAAGTPAGAQLVVDGTVVATAPTNSTKIFADDITSFQIVMPNTAGFEGKTAAVNLVGVHNQFADKIWVLQNPNDPEGWQDIVFYIPEISASAAFSFNSEVDSPPPTDPPPTTPPPSAPPATSVKIQKIDALTRENIPGALMRLRGISADVVVTGGTVPSTGDTHWSLNNTGINLSQVLTAGATTASGEVISTVTDGVWCLEGLPYGAYIVEEERAPNNYSLLPQHTAYGFWLLPPDVTVDVIGVNVIQCPETGEVLETVVDYEIREDANISSILITFENYPFGTIEVTKYDEVTGAPLFGAHFRIQGYFPEGNPNGMPIDRVQVTREDGRTVFTGLPAGQYTILKVG